jgi:hypothetical protein
MFAFLDWKRQCHHLINTRSAASFQRTPWQVLVLHRDRPRPRARIDLYSKACPTNNSPLRTPRPSRTTTKGALTEREPGGNTKRGSKSRAQGRKRRQKDAVLWGGRTMMATRLDSCTPSVSINFNFRSPADDFLQLASNPRSAWRCCNPRKDVKAASTVVVSQIRGKIKVMVRSGATTEQPHDANPTLRPASDVSTAGTSERIAEDAPY